MSDKTLEKQEPAKSDLDLVCHRFFFWRVSLADFSRLLEKLGSAKTRLFFFESLQESLQIFSRLFGSHFRGIPSKLKVHILSFKIQAPNNGVWYQLLFYSVACCSSLELFSKLSGSCFHYWIMNEWPTEVLDSQINGQERPKTYLNSTGFELAIF